MGEAMATFPVDFKYTYRDFDRHGRPRIYFHRGKGHKRVRLRASPGTAEFEAEYRAAFSGVSNAPTSASAAPIIPGSFRERSIAYFSSAGFLELDPETQRVRRRVIESMWAEPLKPGSPLTFATCPLTKFGAAHVVALRDRKKDAPDAANSRLKALSKLFEFALGETGANPVRGIKRLKSKSKTGHKTWPIEWVRAYEDRHPIGTKARLALALLLFTGFRISDLAEIGRQHARNGRIRKTLRKNRNRSPVVVDIPILPELAAVIEKSTTGDLHFLVTEYGKPFSIKGLGQKFREWCDKAGVPGSAHGVRKAGATIAAENGATESQLMAIFGWTDPKQAAIYTKAANRKRLASDGMHALVPNETATDDSHPFVQVRELEKKTR